MIFPLLAGFGNYFVPLQIGALDMAFPRINALSFWLLPVGGLTILSGFLTKGGGAAAGWTNYPPLSEQLGTGEDLWLIGLMIVGTASILGGINFIVTILRMRTPGMTMMRMPVFTWSILATSLLVVLAAPVLTAGLLMVFFDRQLGTSFFVPGNGGVVILWQNVFWFFGHPEVYMLILGAWGIVTEIVSVFSGKPIFSYRGVVLSFLLITALSFSVWAHHMFATGTVELPFFSVTTELISIPTGVLFFIWLATLWRGRLRFEPPMLFALGFIAMFLIGGIDGVWAASPAMDFADPRHVLGGGASPLRLVRGHPVRCVRRDVLLVPQDDRTDALASAGHLAVLAPDSSASTSRSSRCTSSGCAACRGESPTTPRMSGGAS